MPLNDKKAYAAHNKKPFKILDTNQNAYKQEIIDDLLKLKQILYRLWFEGVISSSKTRRILNELDQMEA